MSEFYTQPSPLNLLERDYPSVIKTSIILTQERCYCGNCNNTLSEHDSSLDRCPNIDCGTPWQRLLMTSARVEATAYAPSLSKYPAREYLEYKRYEKIKGSNPVPGYSRPTNDSVQVNPKYL